MAKVQKKLEQHPLAKLFPAPDAAALDALRKRTFRAGKLKYPVFLFEGEVLEHWPEYCACLEFDLSSLNTNKLQSEDRLKEDYEAEVRKIKTAYKDKRQILNHDMHLRLSLADTPEEKTQLQEELTTKRRNITELQNVRLEQLRLRYEKKRTTLLKANAKIIRTLRRACQAEVVSHTLEEKAQYLVYMRWDYELGKLSLQAAWDKIQRFDERAQIYTLKSDRQVLSETEAITITHTAEIAKATANAINRKKFCSGQKVLRPDSYIPSVFDRVGAKFTEKERSKSS